MQEGIWLFSAINNLFDLIIKCNLQCLACLPLIFIISFSSGPLVFCIKGMSGNSDFGCHLMMAHA